ncbi:MAG TPA: hypothetical protein VF384_19060 [Planctomycetota bacterium]
MRAVIMVAAVVAAFVVALSLDAGREPDGLAPVQAIELPLPSRAPGEPARDVPEPTVRAPVPVPVPVPVPETLPPLEVLLCERLSLAPLSRVKAKLWVYGHDGNRSMHLEVDNSGRAWIAREVLLTAIAIDFEVTLPEFSQATVVRSSESSEQLRERVTPLRVLIPRGRLRDVRVVDENGAGVEGARIEGEMLTAVVTDAQGVARPCLTDPPQDGVYVCAPGRRFQYVRVPPADEPWTVVLRRANRLEITLDTSGDPGGHHVDVRLSRSFADRPFYQSKYVQTPGRAVDDTPGSWSPEREHGFSRWQLGFGPGRLAVLDQLHDGGPIELELWRFDELLERRSLELPCLGAVTRVGFRAAPAPPDVELRVLDRTDTPLCGASVRAAPRPGAAIDALLEHGFPVWAPKAVTDERGVCHLPRPTAPATVFVFGNDGYAFRALTLAELIGTDFTVRLEPAFAVDVEVRGRDGEVLTEGATTGPPVHVRPRALLGHDTWLDAAGGGDGPVFHFQGLPAGVVEFRFTHLDPGQVLRHDARVPAVRFVAAESVGELMLGK